jgi:hypothetical protein
MEARSRRATIAGQGEVRLVKMPNRDYFIQCVEE